MLAMILMPFGLDGWAFAIMGKGLTVMIAIADWFSALSPIDWSAHSGRRRHCGHHRPALATLNYMAVGSPRCR
jgi:hypothetical protein